MRRGLRIAVVAGAIGIGCIAGTQPSFAQATATVPTLDQWQGFIAAASHRFGIPIAWIRAVMGAESGGDPRALSPKGAMGLMQLMPGTWAGLRAHYGLGTNPYDPQDNILAGTAYLHELYNRYGYPDLFAAYNAGPGRFDAHLFNGQTLPDETRAYLAALGQPAFEPREPPAIASGASLFFALHDAAELGVGQPEQHEQFFTNGLFVPLNTVPVRKP